MSDEPPSKKPKPEAAVERSEADAFQTQSRAGYFGDATAVTDSNARGDPRIVLHPNFGDRAAPGARAPFGVGLVPPRAPSASLAALGLSEAEVSRALAGCAGRYENKVVIVTGGARGIGESATRARARARAGRG